MTLGSIFSLLSESGILNNVQQSQSPAGEVVNLVGSLLGGGQAAPASGQSLSPGDEVANLLGSLLGGVQTPAASGQTPAASGQNVGGDILDLILNVVQSPAASSQIQPIVNMVAAKIGIPPETALTVVTFAIHYLATNHGTKIANGEDMSDILQQHSNANFVEANNIATQLADKTGLDSQTAAKAMTEVFKLLGVNQ